MNEKSQVNKRETTFWREKERENIGNHETETGQLESTKTRKVTEMKETVLLQPWIPGVCVWGKPTTQLQGKLDGLEIDWQTWPQDMLTLSSFLKLNVGICVTVTTSVWHVTIGDERCFVSPRILSATAHCYLERGPVVWDRTTLSNWKQGTIVAQWFWGLPATVSG